MRDAKEANRILEDAKEEHHFSLKDGSKLKNLKDLHSSLVNMSDDVFSHHVNSNRNDFSNWVKHVHKDEELATRISNIKKLSDIRRHVGERIGELHMARKGKSKVRVLIPFQKFEKPKKTIEARVSGVKVRKVHAKKKDDLGKKLTEFERKGKVSIRKISKKGVKPVSIDLKPKVKKIKVKKKAKKAVKKIKVVKKAKKKAKPKKAIKKVKPKKVVKNVKVKKKAAKKQKNPFKDAVRATIWDFLFGLLIGVIIGWIIGKWM